MNHDWHAMLISITIIIGDGSIYKAWKLLINLLSKKTKTKIKQTKKAEYFITVSQGFLSWGPDFFIPTWIISQIMISIFYSFHGLLNIYLRVQYAKTQYFECSVFSVGFHSCREWKPLTISYSIFTYTNDFAVSRKDTADRYIG